jgi:mono/diheme cytochrome c family protein
MIRRLLILIAVGGPALMLGGVLRDAVPAPASAEERAAPAANPHGDLVYRATRARQCSDCHGAPKAPNLPPSVLNSDAVRELVAKGKGNHGPGRFADCFRCHAGGRLPDASTP